MRKKPDSAWVCRHCGLSAGLWAFGWKHHNGGWRARKTCGRKLTAADVITLGEWRAALTAAIKGAQHVA